MVKIKTLKTLTSRVAALLLLYVPLSNAHVLLKDGEIESRLCSKRLCVKKWDDFVTLACAHTTGHEPYDQDYVFDSFSESGKSCVCPCNFLKFYREQDEE